jgi:hypothetical protein
VAWGGHENWAADRGCHAATCSWKEIPRKHGIIHGRSSPNPPPAQVTKPAPRRIGRTQAHKLLLMGCGAPDRKSCHLQLRSGSVRAHAGHAEIGISFREMQLARTVPDLTSDMPSLFHSPRTSRPSTAGREARIQRRTFPAVGCAVLLAVGLFSQSDVPDSSRRENTR